MIIQTKTKINIGLSVVSKREDGFHDIESIFYPIDYGDVLEVLPSRGSGKIEFTTFGIDIPGKPASNICVKAYHILNKAYRLPSVQAGLLKRVPIGAGLGGGSSDGVVMLQALNTLFELQLPKKLLENYALQLGSDCPFFVDNLPKLVSGRGEKMKEIQINLSHYWVALIFPEFHVSTPLAYSLITPQKSRFDLSKISQLKKGEWKDQIINDFEKPILKIHPEVAEIKEQLSASGAFYVSMTGSGSTIYGIFEKKPTIDMHYSHWIGRFSH